MVSAEEELLHETSSQADAMRWARYTYLALNGGGSLLIMGANGNLRRTDTVPSTDGSSSGLAKAEVTTVDELLVDVDTATLTHRATADLMQSDDLDKLARTVSYHLLDVGRPAQIGAAAGGDLRRFAAGVTAPVSGVFVAVKGGTNDVLGVVKAYQEGARLSEPVPACEWVLAATADKR